MTIKNILLPQQDIVPENSNSSNDESYWELSDFLSSNDSCDECLL